LSSSGGKSRLRAEELLFLAARTLIARPVSVLGGPQSLEETATYKPLSQLREPLSLESTNARIADLLERDEPFFVGRFGSTELRATLRWFNRAHRTVLEKLFGLAARREFPFFSPYENRKLAFDSGFYPIEKNQVERFAKMMIDSMDELDLLASWVPGENIFADRLAQSELTNISDIEPFFARNPWTASLKNKKVLVIHPFTESIKEQYSKRRTGLFDNPLILPEFDLATLKAVQSLGGPDSRFPTWFDALDWMTEESLRQSFDVAIIGCGAYGFPLSARLKRSGRQVVHLGGVTQLLFGIAGHRWDQLPRYRNLYNERWTRPSSEENPQASRKLGQASYW